MALSEVADIVAIRAQFPSLENGFVFMENAGGSQMPRQVAKGIQDYLLDSFVQTGATYEGSVRATTTIDQARDFATLLMNGQRVGKSVFGSSASALTRMIADAYGDIWEPGDEVIVCDNGHEANIGAWVQLGIRGIVVRTWRIDPKTQTCKLSDLEALINERTRMIAVTHVSNLLGEIVDLKSITFLAHKHRVRVFVDGVAFAPHRAIDVEAWGVDWYVFTGYKVFGPHLGVLFGRNDAMSELTGPNHFFVPKDAPNKFELGCLPHELCAGFLALGNYLRFVAGDEVLSRSTVEKAFEQFSSFEAAPQSLLIDSLVSNENVTIWGPRNSSEERVSTVSFTHKKRSPEEIVTYVDGNGIGIRNGHMYAYRLCKALGVDLNTGVVRVSLVHYNTVEEVERLVTVLGQVL